MPLSELLDRLPVDRPVALFLRHAEREPIADPMFSERALLTARGHADAEALGRALRRFACVEVGHSPMPRCRQTAERVVCGATSAGIPAAVTGPESALAGPYFRDARGALELARDLGDGFVRAWFDGKVPERFIQPVGAAAAGQLRAFVRPLSTGVPGVHVRVSHDWNVMLVVEHYFARKHEERGWAAFLDGVAAYAEGARLRLMCDGESRELDWRGI